MVGPAGSSSGVVFDIKRFAIHDGPGIRTTVFLKGCPLACLWCHNPEGVSPRLEHSWRAGRCTGCRACAAACPRRAIELRDGKPATDLAACDFCGRCAEACPTGAREIVGRRMTVEDVLAVVRRDEVFYDESGGGATFSGGEPLAQPEFLRELLAACKARGIATAVDTSCLAPWDVLDGLRGDVDLFLCDLKHMDDATHRRLTGVGNELILANLRRLAAAGAAIIVRVPVVPGCNDDEAGIMATGRFARSLGCVRRVDILPYHEGARGKLARLTRPGEAPAAGPPEIRPPPAERMAQIAEQLTALGLNVKVGG